MAIFLGVALIATQVPWIRIEGGLSMGLPECAKGLYQVPAPGVDAVLMPARLVSVTPVGSNNMEVVDFTVTDEPMGYDAIYPDAKSLDTALAKDVYPNVWVGHGEGKVVLFWVQRIDRTRDASINGLDLWFLSPIGIPFWVRTMNTTIGAEGCTTGES